MTQKGNELNDVNSLRVYLSLKVYLSYTHVYMTNEKQYLKPFKWSNYTAKKKWNVWDDNESVHMT